jgi:uncharacterized RDD family membrane protein YckC
MTSATNYAAASPVAAEETRVTGRRVIQYIVDGFLSSIIPYVLYFALNRGHGGVHVLGVIVAAVLSIAWYVWYWVFRPHRANGQTFGMQLFSVRVISKDGGPPSIGQLLVRWIFLIVDTLFACLVGLITILCSRQRQRVGDHVASTLVIRANGLPSPPRVDDTGAGAAGPVA